MEESRGGEPLGGSSPFRRWKLGEDGGMSKWDVGSVLFSLSAQYAERSLRLTKELMRCRNPKRTTYEVAPLFSYEKLEIAEIDDSNKS